MYQNQHNRWKIKQKIKQYHCCYPDPSQCSYYQESTQQCKNPSVACSYRKYQLSYKKGNQLP